jgi:tRNA A37 threonylcarbamoyladenosine modification protein TsaB
LLEALANAGQSRGRVTAALDAGRNEVFLAEYEVDGAVTSPIRERLLSRDKWLESAGEEIIVTPDRAIAEAARVKGLPVIEVERPRSDAIAQIGWRKIVRGETVSAEALDATYIGRSEAELFVKGS